MVGAANQVADDDEIEIALGKARAAEHRHFGDCIILAVAGAPLERRRSGRPHVGFPELNLVIDEAHPGVDVAIDRVEPLDLLAPGQRLGIARRSTIDAAVTGAVPASVERGAANRQSDRSEQIRPTLVAPSSPLAALIGRRSVSGREKDIGCGVRARTTWPC